MRTTHRSWRRYLGRTRHPAAGDLPRGTVFARAAPMLAVVLCSGGLVFEAAAADWRSEAAASRLAFIPTFEKAPVPGVFREFDAQVRLDPARPADSRIEVNIAVTSADMGIPDVNREIRGTDWFDYVRFPQAGFRSAEVRRAEGSGRFVARGILALKGVQQRVDVPFSWSETGDVATMEGELTLARGVFGIGQGEWAATNYIGADVQVKFRLQLRKVP